MPEYCFYRYRHDGDDIALSHEMSPEGVLSLHQMNCRFIRQKGHDVTKLLSEGKERFVTGQCSLTDLHYLLTLSINLSLFYCSPIWLFLAPYKSVFVRPPALQLFHLSLSVSLSLSLSLSLSVFLSLCLCLSDSSQINALGENDLNIGTKISF